jgi:hypothetical protein
MSKQAHDNPHENWVEAIGGYAKATAPTAVSDGDVANVWLDANGRVHITGDASATAIPVTGSFATINPLSIPVSVTLTVGATYVSGDFVGTSATPITFANAAASAAGSGFVRSVTISDPAASTATALELWLFNATVTPPADSAAWNLSDADGLKCVGVIPIPTGAQFLSSATGVMHVSNVNLRYTCAATSLFGALVTRGAPTYTGTLQVMLEVERF